MTSNLESRKADHHSAVAHYGKKSVEALEILIDAAASPQEDQQAWAWRQLKALKGHLGTDDAARAIQRLDDALQSEEEARAVTAARLLWHLMEQTRLAEGALLLEVIERAWRDPRPSVAFRASEPARYSLPRVNARIIKPGLLAALADLIRRAKGQEQIGAVVRIVLALLRAKQADPALRPAIVERMASEDAATRRAFVNALGSELRWSRHTWVVEAITRRDIPELDASALPVISRLPPERRSAILQRRMPQDALPALMEACGSSTSEPDLVDACARALCDPEEAYRRAALQGLSSYCSSYRYNHSQHDRLLLRLLEIAPPERFEAALFFMESLATPDHPLWRSGHEHAARVREKLADPEHPASAALAALIPQSVERLQTAGRFEEAQRVQQLGRQLLPAPPEIGASLEVVVQGRDRGGEALLDGLSFVYSYGEDVSGEVSFKAGAIAWRSSGAVMGGASFEGAYTARAVRPSLYLLWVAMPSGGSAALVLDLEAKRLWSAGGSADARSFDEAEVRGVTWPRDA